MLFDEIKNAFKDQIVNKLTEVKNLHSYERAFFFLISVELVIGAR